MLVASQNPPFARTSRFDSELRHHDITRLLTIYVKSLIYLKWSCKHYVSSRHKKRRMLSHSPWLFDSVLHLVFSKIIHWHKIPLNAEGKWEE